MSIPSFTNIDVACLPKKVAFGDGQEYRIGDAMNQLAHDFGLTEQEQLQLLPSGKQAVFANRVGWAKTYLVQAGLLEATKRAHFKITDRGRKALAEGPPSIDNEYLSQFAEFLQFKERGKVPGFEASSSAGETSTLSPQGETPDEILRSTVQQIETAIKKELLDRILAAPPAFF